MLTIQLQSSTPSHVTLSLFSEYAAHLGVTRLDTSLSSSTMRLSVILLFATLAMVGAVADTLELRDAEEQDDLVRCEFRPKRFQGYTACNQQ